MKKLLPILSLLCSFAAFSQEAIPLKGDEIFGSINARQIGPALMSGRVNDLELHPTNPKIMYVGTAGGGIWKSQDGGVTYRSIFDKHIQSIGVVTVDPTDPDLTVWAGTGETWTRNSVSVGDGIYKTTDGGQNWKNMGLKNSERISSIAVNPENSDEVYVGVLGNLWGESDERGVYKTTDGGETWESIFKVNATTGCSDLIVDPTNFNTMYAAFWEFNRTAYSFSSGGANSALYKTTDAGKTWDKIHNGFPTGDLGRFSIAVAPSEPNRLYAVVEAKKDKGLYRSDDGGASWKYLNKDFEVVVRPFYFSRIVVSPYNPDILLKAGLSGYMSKNGGKTFRAINGGVHSDFHDYAFSVSDSSKIYVGTDGGVYRSYDGGDVWEMVRGLPISQFYHVSVDNQKPYNVYGGLQDNGSWFGPSAKAGGVENRDWISVGAGDGFRVYPHPTDPNIVYSEMQGAENIWRINVEKNQLKTIKPTPESADDKLRFNWNAPLSTSLHNPDRLYVASQYIHVSDDRGETWRKMSPDLTTNDLAKQHQEESGGISVDNSGAENHCTIFTINESPINKDIIWVGTDDGNIQVTFDRGENWKNVTANLSGVPKNTWTYFIEPSRFDENTAYAVFDGHTQNDRKPYIQKTTDGGKTWRAINTEGIADFARCIREDLKNPNLLFLGTEQGLYITVDGGQNWSQFTNNMPPVAVHYMVIHPTEDALVMGTHGRGIIIIDDISPLRQITSEIIENELTFIKTKPTIMKDPGSFAGYSMVGDYVGPNPISAAEIMYFMNKRHTFGKMTMKIFDEAGNEVADLSPGKSKGINGVQWNYRLKPPKTANGMIPVQAGLLGPVAPAGTYNVAINKGKKEFSGSIKLMNDPESIYTSTDRTAQHKATMQLFDLNEKVAYLVHQVDMALPYLKNLQEKVTDKKFVKKANLDTFITELSDFKKTLAVSSSDRYVGAEESKLRERVSELYATIATFAGRPSNAQLQNAEVITKSFSDANTKFTEIKNRLTAINGLSAKTGIEDSALLTFPTWEEFKAE